ncbi:MAG: tripartite tricarboxylate transporter TctB family protein [Pseudomonadota bacterium]
MSEDKRRVELPFEEERHGGKLLLGGLAAAAAILLALYGNQTVDGATVSGDLDVGWWAEPGLSPAIFLVLIILASVAGFFVAKREVLDWQEITNEYGRVAIVPACMIATVFLLKITGFALSIFVFTGVVAFIAGFRGTKLVAIAWRRASRWF